MNISQTPPHVFLSESCAQPDGGPAGNSSPSDASGAKGGQPRRQRGAEEAPFEELYCAAFAALDRHWLAARATYMEFPAVMK